MKARSLLAVSVALALAITAAPAFSAEIPKSIPWVDTGPFDHVDGSGPHRDSANLVIQSRAAQLAANPLAAKMSRDVGDVAVIVDDGTLIIPPTPQNLYDLASGTTITFVPGTGDFAVSSAAGGVVADPGGFSLGLTDDSFAAVEAVDSGTYAGFPYFGTTYGTDEIFVGSDGHITFGAGDGSSSPRDAARHVGGPPRVSALLNDLNPDVGGDVRAEVNASSVVVTWDGLPEFGTTNSNTVQAVLYSDGSIDLNYGSVDAAVGVVGVAEGDNETPFTEIDYTADLPGTFPAGAIFEEFTFGNPNAQMNTLGVAQRFLESHPDQFDFIVVFTDFVVDIGFGAFAFHQGIKNDTQGLGFFRNGFSSTFDFTFVLENANTGPIDELESVLNMNRIGLYWPSANKMVDPPIKKFRFFCGNPGGQVTPCGATLDGPPGSSQTSRRARWFGTLNGDFGSHGSYTLGLNSAMSLMGQEAGHRWLAFPAFVHPGFFFSADLLGRSFAHWSFFHNVTVPPSQFGGDPRASSAEGNAILDLGAGASSGLPVPCDASSGETTLLTAPNELIDGFTELDQYFMGLRTAGSVSPFWYADDPRSAFSGASLEGVRGFSAQDDIIFCGKRIDLTVADITNAGLFGLGPGNGPRTPAIGDEDDAATNPACGAGPTDVKTMAFVLLVPNDGATHKDGIKQVDTFRATWQTYANGPATGGLGKFDTSLTPVCH